MDTPEHIDRTRTHDLTIEEIRACPEFSDFTDEQAKEVVETIKTFAKIVFDYYQKKRQKDRKIAFLCLSCM